MLMTKFDHIEGQNTKLEITMFLVNFWRNNVENSSAHFSLYTFFSLEIVHWLASHSSAPMVPL